MMLKQIIIQDIDVSCEDFRISEMLDVPSIVDSIREIGQLSPAILLERGPSFVIVCGFRRIHALRQFGKSEVWARILSHEEGFALHPFELALRDNLSHRQLDPLEKARVIHKLQTICGIPCDQLIKTYLPLLGLASHQTVLDGYQALHEIHPGLRRSLVEGALTLSSIETLARLSIDEQNSLALLMTRIRLSASLQKKVWGLFEDLSGITGARFDAPLNNKEIQALLGDSILSPFQKGERLCEILYRMRNPRLSLAKERFQAQKSRLGLPGCIRISSHPFFETNDIRVEFDVSSAARFRELASMLQEASQSSELEGLFEA
jgi:ParB-like nuclease domain